MGAVGGQNPYHQKGLQRQWRQKLAPERTAVSQLASGAVSGAAKALRLKGISAALSKTPAVVSMAWVVGGAPSLERTCLCPISLLNGEKQGILSIWPQIGRIDVS